jgi:hypothetical protein
MSASENDEWFPKDLQELLNQPDGAARLLKELPSRYSMQSVADTTRKQGADSPHNIWESCGVTYLTSQRQHEAVAVFEALYEYLLAHQRSAGKRAHKGAPLLWLSDAHVALKRPVTARQVLMLAACEDAILHEGNFQAFVNSGFYIRAVWKHGMRHDLLERYVNKIWSLYTENEALGMYPEWIVQDLDQEWMTTYPTPLETAEFRITKNYVQHLLGTLGDGKGLGLERLAHYLLSSTPGCRAYMRKRTHSTDLDVAGAFEGPVQDFRSDLGRYFLCECKDWNCPADITAFAKFSRILDSTKSRFGILFSKNGISGEGKTANAEREQLKLFQDRGIVIVVVNESDLKKVASGANFLTMLRTKYEQVRLDLKDAAPTDTGG